MIFSTETRLNPEATPDSIPVIHGKNFYIDEQGYVATYNVSSINCFDYKNRNIAVQSIKEVTEFIYIINNKLAYKTDVGFLVTELDAIKENYVGGFQGIAGFNETETNYQYINNNEPIKSSINLTGRINSSKQLEIQLDADNDIWCTPLGEFRCYINNTFYCITYDTPMPNSFGDTFSVVLAGWTSVSLTDTTNYIRDIHISGNTLYLSTRLQIIGSTPYDWSSIDTSVKTVIWSEDSRLTGCYFEGSPTASYFFMVNYNTSSIYWVSGDELEILQEYEHRIPILGVGSVDKFMLAIVDKEACTLLQSYVSLNTWLMKTKMYFQFNQLSAYEEMITQYVREEVHYARDLNSLIIESTQRAPMILYIIGDKIQSGCHTDTSISAGDFAAYQIQDGVLYRYYRVEDSGDYNEIDEAAGIINYESYIYIGSDLEPDVGGSTMKDTEILFEGKLAIVDGDDISIESSSDKPVDQNDLPVRTQQTNPDNWWYLYSKTLRYPISYTDWIRISLMPTTKIYNIRLAEDLTKGENNNGSKSKKRK